MNKNIFNVIIYNFNKKEFEPYNILNYLDRAWENDKSKNWFVFHANDELKTIENANEVFENDEYFKGWVISTIKHEFWSRCQYEIILKEWPGDYEYKTDIYEQASMNMDLIIKLFKDNLSI